MMLVWTLRRGEMMWGLVLRAGGRGAGCGLRHSETHSCPPTASFTTHVRQPATPAQVATRRRRVLRLA